MLLLIAAFALLFSAEQAHAAFLVAPFITAISGGAIVGAAASFIGSLVVGVISIGASLLLRKQPQGAADAGVELDVRVEPDVPQSLMVGRFVAAGSMIYAEAYGDNNQNCIQIIALADHPIDAVETVFLEAQSVDLTDTMTIRGSTVDGYDGNVAIKFYDGSQVAADAFAVSALSANPERPWTSSHKGLGRSYARVHYIYDRDKVQGLLGWKFVGRGARLYDPRLDDTVGGSGDQRFDDLDTHAWTANLAVIAYNIVRGIRVKDDGGDPVHFYGLKGTPAANVPLDVWFAAMNEADVAVSLAGGGTEPQFHGGMEIPVSMEPLEALRQICKATGGRFVENGGVYKLYLGAPGLPVAAIDDGIIPANRSDLFEPITPLEQKITYITGSYTSVEEAREADPPPPRIDAAQELEIGQRIEADLDAPMVQSLPHMQRLMQQMLLRAKRQRRHTVPLPPALFGVEPGDVIEWTSERNGYDGKLFEVLATEIDVNLITVATLLEVDPTDYDWSSGDEIPQATGSVLQARPAPKIIDEFGVTVSIHEGDGGAKRPAINVFWVPPDDDDIIGLSIQIRRPSLPLEVAAFPINEPEAIAAGEAIILAGLAPLTNYEVRARFVTFSGRASEWSLWIPVTTPDTRVSQAELDASLDARVRQIEAIAGDLFTIHQDVDLLAAATNSQFTSIAERLGRVLLGVGARYKQNKAGAQLALTASADAAAALAAIAGTVFASTGAGTAEALFTIAASSDLEDGDLALVEFLVKAGYGEEFVSAAFEMAAAYTEALGLHSRVRIRADQFDMIIGGVTTPGGLLIAQNEPKIVPIVGGYIQADLRQRESQFVTTLTEDPLMRMPIGGWVGYRWDHTFVQDSVGDHAVAVDPVVFPSGPPDILPNPGYTSVVACKILSLNPPKAIAVFDGGGNTSLGSNTSFALSVPYNGYSYWDVTVDGPLIIDGPYNGTITPLGSSLDVKVTLYGGGSQGRSSGGDFHNFGWLPGQDSTFDTMLAEGGGKTAGPGFSRVGTSGGTASGGGTNTNGNTGGTAVIDGVSGTGAGAPDGGGDVPGVLIGTPAGSVPGGGGAGEGRSGQQSGGGGGSGAKTAKTYSGTWVAGKALVVGDGGKGTGAIGGVDTAGNFGGWGAPGRAIISLP